MNRSRRLFAVSIVVALVLSGFFILQASTMAAPAIQPVAMPEYMKYIQINNFRFDPLAETPLIPAALRHVPMSPGTDAYYLVQFAGPVTPEMKRSLEASGASILDYVPYNAFVVRADSAAMDRASTLPVVRWTGAFEPAYKLSPRLAQSYDHILQEALEQNLRGPDQPTSDPIVSFDGMFASKSLLPSTTGPFANSGSGAAGPSAGVGPSIAGPSASFGSAGSMAGLTIATSGTGPSLGPKATFGAGGVSPEILPVRIDTSKQIPIVVKTFEASRVMEAAAAIKALGGLDVRVAFASSGAIKATVPRDMLPAIARELGVLWIDRDETPYAFNDIARWVVQSGDGETYATPIHDMGIWGTGQTVTVGDTGIDYEHDAFEDPNNTTPGPNHRKVTDYYPICPDRCDDTDNGINHGTHVSGSVAGDDGTWHVYDGDPTGSSGSAGPHDGQAFDAFVQVQDTSDDGFFIYFDDILDLWEPAVARDSWIHTNSWGSCCGEYISEAAITDDFIFTNQDFIVLFAAGNSGSGLGSMNPFAGAKNVIAVGATSNGPGRENVADFSSRGPMNDGRLKPDVMTPGVSLWSARGCDPGGECDDYFTLSGTSMATPTAAGTAALVRQYYMDGWYPTGTKESSNGFTPSAALVKATLINSAAEMTGSGAYGNGQNFYPNMNQGWGRILLDDGLFFQGEERGLSVHDNRDGINTGTTIGYLLAIGTASVPVEITLVWSDAAGTPGSTPNLVNDLELLVTAPDGTVYRGNQFVGANPGESEPNPSGEDHLNNVESVLVITDVQSGLWNVEVVGLDIPVGPQSYAIVMTGGIATEKGLIRMDKERYQSTASPQITVTDTGPNADPGAPDTISVTMYSDTEPAGETVTLTETGNSTSVFTGSIDLDPGAPTEGDGILQVTDGDAIIAEYFDDDDGLGGSGFVTDEAVVDDTAPVISGVSATNLRFSRATIVWTTDESSDSVVHWGETTPPTNTVSSARRVTNHTVTLSGLLENTTYYFSVESTDEAGNLALDDNGGAYYSFTTPLKPPTAPPDEWWPTFHNNQPRQGISPSTHVPPINQEWTDGTYLLQLWNGVVFADDVLYSAPLDGFLRARDAFSGDILWERKLGDQYYYTGTMAVDNGVLYATFYGNAGGFVYALNAYTGETIWRVGQADAGLDFNARIQMAYADGLVFGTSWDGRAYALSAADGSVAWTAPLDQITISGATINAGIAYFTTVGGTVFALDEFGGDLVWSRTLDNTITTTPLYAQGNVYAGTYSGTMYALEAFTGDIMWQTGGFSLIDLSTPAYDGSSIFFGTFGNQYVALDATDGSQLWARSIGGPVGTAPAYANGFVYGTSWDGQLYTFDAFDGRIVDQDDLIAFGSTSFPAISDGWVWLEDNDGNIYGFFGQLAVGLTVNPSRQTAETVPDSTVDHAVTVKNIGISGPDVFDASVTLGSHGWATDLYEADGTTPLADTDGDSIPDTGSLATGATVGIVIRVTVPATIAPGDSDTAVVTFTSSNDVSRSKTGQVTTTVPPPGVAVGPRAYFTPNPGDTVVATMDVRNTGGFADIIDMTAISDRGWTVRLFEADGTTPLTDHDADGVPDVGQVTGLQSATIVIEVDVPADAAEDTVQRAAITGASSLDPTASGTGTVVIELVPPPHEEWPTFHNNPRRHGESPSVHEPPMNLRWSDGPHLLQLWNGPVVADGILYSAPLDGVLRARDAFTGEVLWSRVLGGQYFYTGTPTLADGVLYATFYTQSGGTVYALDAYTGETIWSVGIDETGLDFNARVAMAHADGMVFGAAWGDFFNGEVYALDASDGSQVWVVDAQGLPFGGAAVVGGAVYIGTTSGWVYAIDEFTGAVLWSVSLDNTVTAAPLIAQGNVFVGTYSGSMYALDTLTGDVLWQTSGFGLIDLSTPAYDGTAIYFGDFNNEYVALDVATGDVIWRTSIGGPVGTSPAYANGFVYGTSWDGQLYTFDAANGDIVDQDDLISFGSTSFPAVSDGWLWLEDYDGNAYAFLGQVAVGLTVSPSRQGAETVPDSTVEYVVTVTNVGISGADTFDATVTLGDLGWATALYEADGTTPLSDTDGDGVPDTGSLATDASVDIVIRVTVPAAVNPGDADTAFVSFTSSNDVSRLKSGRVTTLVPLPGVAVGPRAYFKPQPGETVAATMEVRNKGGFPDTIDVTATSDIGWTLRLFTADGVTPLTDSDGDGVPDVGLVPGLKSATIVVEADVPAATPPDTLQRATITGTSSRDTGAIGTTTLVIELVPPPNDQWPTFHNNARRHGESPSPHEPPVDEKWRTDTQLQHLWTGPVLADDILYSTTLDGYIRARDPFTGEVLWQRQLGDQYYYTGTPTVANGVVYATFYGIAGGSVYALSGRTGATLWSSDREETGLDFNARVAMAHADGRVFGAAWGDFFNGQVYALDASDGSKEWVVDAQGLPFGGGAVVGGTVYYGTTAGWVYAIDASSGTIRWSVPLDGTVTSPPLVAQGNVFIGTYSGTMFALDAESGETVWSTSGFGLIDLSTPAYDGTAIYFGTFNNEYVALDVGTGEAVWRTPIGGPVGSSVAYANGYVYGTAWDGKLRTLRASDGQIVDTKNLGSFASTSMPAVSRGWVWIEDYDGRVYGFGAEGVGELAGIQVTPDETSITVGSAAVFRGSLVDVYGNPMPAGEVTWDSVDDLGVVIELSEDTVVYVAGVRAGADTLRATSSGMSGTASISLTPGALDHIGVDPAFKDVPAGTQWTFTASGEDQYGNDIPGGSFTWSVAGDIGQINPSTGVFTAGQRVGTGTVTAASGSRVGSAIVRIVPGPAVRVAVSVQNTDMVAGSSTIFSASVRDAFGNVVSTDDLTWSRSSGTLTSMSSDNRVYQYTAPTSTSPATQTVTVSSGSLTSGTITINVVPGPAAAILISSAAQSVTAGGTLAFDARVVDAYNNELTDAAVEWHASRGTIPAGVLTAPPQVGTVIVTASYGGREAVRAIEVTPGPLSRLVTSTSSIRVAPGAGITVTVAAEDAYGNDVAVSSFSWEATIGSLDVGSNGQIASFFAGETAGTGTITVSAGGQTKTISVTVTEPSVSLVRQATSPTSLTLLVVAIIAIAASIAMFVRYNASRRELEELRRGGGGGGAGGASGVG